VGNGFSGPGAAAGGGSATAGRRSDSHPHLWLEGLEEHNANTRERYIYIHGTNHEEEIGQAASNGCIRMKNADLIALFDRVPLGPKSSLRPSEKRPKIRCA
jgi:hypothetical protein